MRTRLSAIAVAALLVIAIAPTASAAPLPEPPSADHLTVMTNAMLRRADVPAPLQVRRGLRVSAITPPGGQDPLPICSRTTPTYRTVSLPLAGATGYEAMLTISAGALWQTVYEYRTEAQAAKALSSASRAALATCTGRDTLDDSHADAVATTWTPSAGSRGIQVLSRQSAPGDINDEFVTVLRTGAFVQMVRLSSTSGPSSAAQRAAIRTLSRGLAARLTDPGALPNTQDPLVTHAEHAMLQLGDLPSALPVTQPAAGGWSSFFSDRPPLDGPDSCLPAGSQPEGMAKFSMSLGGSGGPMSIPGSAMQEVSVYPSQAAAQTAWASLVRTQRGCTVASEPISRTEPATRTAKGSLRLGDAQLPALWWREFNTYPDDSGSGFTTSAYSIALNLGTAIQVVTYATSRSGVGSLTLDQAAVNALAEQLAQRWQR